MIPAIEPVNRPMVSAQEATMILDRIARANVLPSAPRLDRVRAYLARAQAHWEAASARRSAPAGHPAYWQGFAACQEGLDPEDNPHRPGSWKSQVWLLGWQKGLED